MFKLRDTRTQKEMVDNEVYKRKMAYEERMNNFIDYVLIIIISVGLVNILYILYSFCLRIFEIL